MNQLAASFQSGMGAVNLIAGIVLIGLIVYFVLYLRKLHAKEMELRDEISEAYTDDTIQK